MQAIGWRERVELPDLGVRLTAKVDTGARSAALHATAIREFLRAGRPWVRFQVPGAGTVEVPLIGHRVVRDSGGHAAMRPFIRIRVRLGGRSWWTEVGLVDRAPMRYPMLLGRRALGRRFAVDPRRSFLLEHPAALASAALAA